MAAYTKLDCAVHTWHLHFVLYVLLLNVENSSCFCKLLYLTYLMVVVIIVAAVTVVVAIQAAANHHTQHTVAQVARRNRSTGDLVVVVVVADHTGIDMSTLTIMGW